MLKPNKKYIIVEPKKHNEIRESGLILQDDKKINNGIVIEIGGKNPGYCVGDTVIYREWGFTLYEYNGKKLLIIKKEDIIAYETT